MAINCKPKSNGLHKDYFTAEAKYNGFHALLRLNIITATSLYKNEKELFEAFPLIELIYGNQASLSEFNSRVQNSKNAEGAL